MKKLLFTFLFLSLFIPSGLCADRYWVDGGSSTSYNATGNTNWGTASGVQDNASVPTSSDAVIFDANSTGPAVITATAACLSANFTGYTGTLTHNAGRYFQIYGSLTFVAGMTYTNVYNSYITIYDDGTLTTGGHALGNLSFVKYGGTLVLGDNLTFVASKLCTFVINATTGTVDLNGKTISGNSATNRILIRATALGTAMSITVNGGDADNADFRDITADGAWDLSGNSTGDCGGNTNITFTTADTMYWHVDAGSWSDSGQWFLATNGVGAGRVPLPQDDAVFDSNSFDSGGQTVTQDMPRIGKSINYTGVTDTPTVNDTVAWTIYGSLTLIAGMTWSHNQLTYFQGRGAFTLTSAGNAFGTNVYIQMVGGTLTFQDAFSIPVGYVFSLSNGTLVATTSNVTVSFFTISSGTTLTMGSGTWSVDATWNMSSGATLNAETSTISFDTYGASDRTFIGGGKTYNNLTIGSSGTGIATLSGATNNIFNVFTITKPKTVKFTAGTTTTVSSFVADGDAVDGIVITSATSAAHTLSDASGTNAVSYCTISYSEAGGGATWDATDNCTDGGNNTGWDFAAVRRRMWLGKK